MSNLRLIAHMSVARGYGVLLSLLTLFVSARLLGPEGRGEFAAAIAWASLLATLCNLSLGQALQHRLQSAVSRPSLAEQLGTLGRLAVILSALAAGAAVTMYVATDGTIFKGLAPSSLLVALLMIPFLIWEQYTSNISAAAAQTGLLNRSQYWGRTAGFALFFLLVMYLQWGVRGALLSQLAGQVLVTVLVTLPLWRLGGRALNWVAGEVTPLLRSGVVIHLTTVSAFLLDQISILLINNYLEKQDVGHYQLAQQMVGLMLIVPQSALMVIYGGLASSRPDQFWPQQRRINQRVLAGLAVLALLAYALAPALIRLVAGEAFAPSAAMFRALLPTVLGVSLALLMTPQWIGRGLLKLNTILTIVTSAVVVACSALAIPRFGVDGAIYVRLGVYAVWIPMVQLIFWAWCSRRARSAGTGMLEEGVK